MGLAKTYFHFNESIDRSENIGLDATRAADLCGSLPPSGVRISTNGSDGDVRTW